MGAVVNGQQYERLVACLRVHGCSEEWIAYAMPGLMSEIKAMLVTTADAAYQRGVASVPKVTPHSSYPSSSSGGFDATSFIMGSLFNPF